MGKREKTNQPTVPYQPTPPEADAIAANAARKTQRAPLVPLRLKSCEGGVAQIQVNHADPAAGEVLFQEQLATDDQVFASFVSEQLAFLSIVKGAINENVLNAHLSTVRAVQPRDGIETMLACQMAAVHVLTMTTAADAYASGKSPYLKDQKLAQVNKLSRTFTTQMEALKRYRSKGDQKIIVEHVEVHDGGQAVVGSEVHPR